MRCIKRYVGFFEEELSDAKKYINNALAAKVDGKISEYELSLKLVAEEMTHALHWYNLAVETVARLKDSSPESQSTEWMLEMWKEEQQEYIECVSKLKYELEQAKR